MICMTNRFYLSQCLEYFRISLLFTSFLFLNNIVDELKSSVPLYLNKTSPVKESTNQRACFFSPVSQTHQVVDLHGLLSELTASIGAGHKKVAALRKLWILDLFVSSTSSWVKIYLNAIQKYVYLFSVVYVICRHVDNVWESSFKIISGRVVASSPCGTLDPFSGNLKLCEIPFSYQRMKKSDTVKWNYLDWI